MVWAAVCGNVAAVEKLLNINDGGAPPEEQGEKAIHQEKDDTFSKEQKEGVVKPTQSSEGGNDRGISSEKQEKEGADATQNEVVNDGGAPSEKQREKTGEEATPDEGDLGAADEEQVKGRIEEVLQPLHAAASVGSEKVCTVLINAGAKVPCTSIYIVQYTHVQRIEYLVGKIHVICCHQQRKTVKILLKLSINLLTNHY